MASAACSSADILFFSAIIAAAFAAVSFGAIAAKHEEGMKKEEAERLLSVLDDKMNVILLDERGQQPDSVQFARKLEQWVDSGKVPTFVIGGAYGFHESVLQKFPQKISLSNMVMTHQLARVVLLEQIYRALNILKGTEYHK